MAVGYETNEDDTIVVSLRGSHEVLVMHCDRVLPLPLIRLRGKCTERERLGQDEAREEGRRGDACAASGLKRHAHHKQSRYSRHRWSGDWQDWKCSASHTCDYRSSAQYPGSSS